MVSDLLADSEQTEEGPHVTEHRVYKISFASVYPLYVKKAERKKRTKKEVDRIILWLTGYDSAGLQKQLKNQVTFETFFAEAPRLNPGVALIKGVICGVRVEDIKDPLMRKIRYLDKLIDELAAGKAMEKILRGEEAPAGEVGSNPAVDGLLARAKSWKAEMAALRQILLKAGLTEELKWRLPCYSAAGKNIAIIQPFKACLGLMFFKGELLQDPRGLLAPNGPNSRSSRRLEMRSVDEVKKRAPAIAAFVKAAIKIEQTGQKVEKKTRPTQTPPELKTAFAKNPRLKKAFAALTPGRQRAYLLHFAGAKQMATREARIKKLTPRILAGKGLTDH